MLTFTETLFRDHDGVLFVRYAPVLAARGAVTYHGELGFASWDVMVGAPLDAHENAKRLARENAVSVLRTVVSQLEGGELTEPKPAPVNPTGAEQRNDR